MNNEYIYDIYMQYNRTCFLKKITLDFGLD
jgi:hypothetical protein